MRSGALVAGGEAARKADTCDMYMHPPVFVRKLAQLLLLRW